MKKVAIIIPIIASVAIIASVLCVKTHRSESSRFEEATLETPYLKVVAAIGKKSSFERILESGDARLEERTWDNFKFDLKSMPRLSSWEMLGKGHFKVLSLSKDFPGSMGVEQDIRADRGGITVDSKIKRPCGFIKEYETKMSISNSRPPVLRIENRIVYERPVPFWMAEKMDSMVDEHNKRRVDSMVEAIRSILRESHPEKTAHQ